MMSGILAWFDTEEQAIAAVVELKKLDDLDMEAYTPVPSEELQNLLGQHDTRLPTLALAAGLFGAASAYLLQWYTQTIAYPLNIGGRPPHAPLAFVPITFETAVLSAGVVIFFAALLLAGLPRLYQPVFEAPESERAMIDAYLLAVSTEGSNVDGVRLKGELMRLGARSASAFSDRRLSR